MNEVHEPICVDRILVSLDTSKHSFTALQIAVDLARHYDASIQGVFVEDVTLLSLAEMPFHQEVGEYTAIVREISIDGMTRSIFVQSKWVIRTFRRLINRTPIRGNITILRGSVIKTIAQEAEKCDLLIIGKSGTNPSSRDKLGSTAKAMIKNKQKHLLLVEEGNHLGYPMIVLYEASSLGKVSLETAKELITPGETLIVLVSEDDPDELVKNKRSLRGWALKNQININIQTYKSRSFENFIQMIDGLKTGLFIAPHIKKIPERRIIELILENVQLPILLIRTPPENR